MTSTPVAMRSPRPWWAMVVSAAFLAAACAEPEVSPGIAESDANTGASATNATEAESDGDDAASSTAESDDAATDDTATDDTATDGTAADGTAAGNPGLESLQPPAPGEPAADLGQWIGLLTSLRGPADSIAEPFESAVGYFPDGIATPPGANLVLDRIDLSADEPLAREGFISYQGLDTLSLGGWFETTLSQAELESFFDSAHGEGDPWALNNKQSNERSDGSLSITYLFERVDRADRPGLLTYQADLVESGGQSMLIIRVSESNVETFGPFERLATSVVDIPEPLDTKAFRHSISADDSTVFVAPQWQVDGAPVDVATDLAARFPSGPFGLPEAPELDGLGDYSFDVVCGDDLLCSASVRESVNGDDRSAVVWSINHFARS